MDDKFSNEWTDLIRDEANLKKHILYEFGIDVIGKEFNNLDAAVGYCNKLAQEVAEETGHDLEFVYDLFVEFSLKTVKGKVGGIIVNECKIDSLFLHEKWM
jgi:hypothetical protein